MSRMLADRQSEAGPRHTGMRMSYEEFVEWLEPGVHAEWIDGEVVMMAPIGGAHNRLHLFLLRLIGEYLDYHPVGEIRFDPFNMKTGQDLPAVPPTSCLSQRRTPADSRGHISKVPPTWSSRQ